MGIIWLLPSTTGYSKQNAQKYKGHKDRDNNFLFCLSINCLQLVQYPPTDLSAIPTSLEVQRQKPQAR